MAGWSLVQLATSRRHPIILQRERKRNRRTLLSLRIVRLAESRISQISHSILKKIIK